MNKFIILVSSIIFSLNYLFGEVSTGNLGAGLGYPYLSIRYVPSDKSIIELRSTISTADIMIGGMRYYYVFNPKSRLNFYSSLEANYIDFKTKLTKGDGYTFGFFLGLEYYILGRLSINFDLGPTIIGLRETKYNYSSTNVDWIINTGIVFYFIRKKPVEKAEIRTTPTEAKPTVEKKLPEIKPVEKTPIIQPEPIPLTEEEKKIIMKKHYNEGIKLLKSGLYKEAIYEFEQVLKYDPNHEPSLIRIKKAKELMKK